MLKAEAFMRLEKARTVHHPLAFSLLGSPTGDHDGINTNVCIIHHSHGHECRVLNAQAQRANVLGRFSVL